MIVIKKNFKVDVLPEFREAKLKSNRVSDKYIRTKVFVVVKGRSHLLLKNSRKRKKLEEEENEVLAFNCDFKTKNNELYSQVEDLESEVNQYMMLYLENLKYKEQLEYLEKRGIINEDGEGVIKFK